MVVAAGAGEILTVFYAAHAAFYRAVFGEEVVDGYPGGFAVGCGGVLFESDAHLFAAGFAFGFAASALSTFERVF